MADSTGVKMASPALDSAIAELKVADAPSTSQSSKTASLQEKKDEPLKTPIADPVESAIPTVQEPILTAEQQSKYDALLEIVKSWKEVPSTQGKGGPITEDETMWLTRECLLRYLRATKWHTAEAAKRVLGTLTWRREYDIESLTPEHISPENETGKQIILGFDVAGRPCQYLNPGRQNTEPTPRQVQHLVFMVERVIDIMKPGQETLALLINFKSSKGRSNTSPPLSQGREVLNILQTHYPERLGKALIINVPWIVWGFFKLITPFIDPLTREKLKFNDNMRQYVPPEQLWTEFQGDLNFDYDHEVYWPALIKLCETKHAEQKARWIAAGKNYGESELYLRGGDAPSVTGKGPDQTASEPQAKEEETAEPASEISKAEVVQKTIDDEASGKGDIAEQAPDADVKIENVKP